ncbi:hypothetical protein BDC45DRAFT_522837, partial [Circinella umbellata]
MDIWIVWNREVIEAVNYVIHIITVIVINYYMDWFFLNSGICYYLLWERSKYHYC